MHSLPTNERVEKIKNDPQSVNRFIEEYKPFIASCAEKVTGRYMQYGKDDELSIALMAFSEAIESYSAQKGNFLSFAQGVIRRRLIDYFRKEKRHSKVISLNEYSDGEREDERDLTSDLALEKYTEEEANHYRRFELLELEEELGVWDITFVDLAEISPKHMKTRKMCNNIIRFLLDSPDLVKSIRQKRYLPVAEIEKKLGIPRKSIERARKYIIAAMIIRTGDYQYLKEFLEVEK